MPQTIKYAQPHFQKDYLTASQHNYIITYELPFVLSIPNGTNIAKVTFA